MLRAGRQPPDPSARPAGAPEPGSFRPVPLGPRPALVAPRPPRNGGGRCDAKVAAVGLKGPNRLPPTGPSVLKLGADSAGSREHPHGREDAHLLRGMAESMRCTKNGRAVQKAPLARSSA